MSGLRVGLRVRTGLWLGFMVRLRIKGQGFYSRVRIWSLVFRVRVRCGLWLCLRVRTWSWSMALAGAHECTSPAMLLVSWQ